MQIAAALSGLFGCSAEINVLPTSEFWPKIVECYIKKNKPELCLTISNMKSFQHFTGRILASFIYDEAGLICHFNALGMHIWLHHWNNNGEVTPRCFHGEKMVNKTITYYFSPTSEEGAKALLSGEGKAEKGKNQKDVVKLTNNDNVVCKMDKNCSFPTVHTTNSCGLIFGNVTKAEAAYRHNVDWTSAMFPKAHRSEIKQKMMIVTKCFCNFANELPQLGRQICKMTPYEIPGSADLDEDNCPNDMMVATARFKTTFVFQCCNPINIKKGRSDPGGKHCDFKLSMIDVRQAIKTAKDMWNKLRETLPEEHFKEPKMQLPMFSFDPKKHSFKNAIVAQQEIVEEEDPFC